MKTLLLNPFQILIAIVFIVFAGSYMVALITAKGQTLFDRQYNNLHSWVVCADITHNNFTLIKGMFEEIAGYVQSKDPGNKEKLEVLEAHFYKKYQKLLVKSLTTVENLN